MPVMPRTEDKAKRIAYKIIGVPSNLRKKTRVSEKGRKSASAKD